MSGATRGMDRFRADYMGMLATVIALALQGLRGGGQPTCRRRSRCRRWRSHPRRFTRHLEKGRVVVPLRAPATPTSTPPTPPPLRVGRDRCAGHPEGYAPGVDGVYSADPRPDATATKFSEVSYREILNQGLKVMDSTAITFCMDNELPIIVFDVTAPGQHPAPCRASASVRSSATD
ncbi:MAG: hypothetical protein U0W40_02435 [Acidimicrobiia bacterium]